jgi:hypothetical protein
MSFAPMIWAMAVKGLTPAAKLVLILAAEAADGDNRAFDLAEIRESANLTEEGFDEVVEELAKATLAMRVSSPEPATGERQLCLQLIMEEGAWA